MRSILKSSLSLPVLALALLAATPASARPPAVVQVDQRELLDELRNLQAQVQALQNQVKKGREGRDMKRGLDDVSAGIARVEAAVRSARPVTVKRPRPQVVAGPVAMDAGSFATLRKTVSGMSFASEKMVVIGTALRSNWIAVDQGKALLSEFLHGSEKVEALRVLWPRVVDRENGFRFYEDFAFESEKRAARKIIDG